VERLRAFLRTAPLTLVVGGIMVMLTGCSTEGETSTAAKTLAIAHPQQQLPGPGARKIRLQATGGQECPGTAHVTDIKTKESDAAVLVSASFQIEPSGYCELRTARGHFDITLQRPLGQRVVIDNSRGRRRVIWSPEIREKNRTTADLTSSDALQFATSRFPQAAGSRCIPVGPYYECRYVRGGQRYRIILRKELGGRFSVFDPPIPDPTCPYKPGVQRGCP